MAVFGREKWLEMCLDKVKALISLYLSPLECDYRLSELSYCFQKESKPSFLKALGFTVPSS
jgi:hypothetical protein